MNHYPDDRRYMSFEERAVDDARYRGSVAARERTITCCGCGKTVTHVNDVPVRMHGEKVVCPRVECSNRTGR